jgi:hypothetical protein
MEVWVGYPSDLRHKEQGGSLILQLEFITRQQNNIHHICKSNDKNFARHLSANLLCRDTDSRRVVAQSLVKRW